MSVVEMSLYQALEKKKILEDRVAREMKNYRLVCVRKANEDVTIDGRSLEDVLENSIRPAYQKTVALMRNLIALKAAINEANAKTIITVGDKEYTIANAMVILRNQDKLVDMYQRMIMNFRSMENEAADLNERNKNNDAINKYLEKTLGDGKRDADVVTKLTDDYIRRNTFSVYDPLDTMKMAQTELDHLERFKNEIHYKLTEANVATKITVEFED